MGYDFRPLFWVCAIGGVIVGAGGLALIEWVIHHVSIGVR